MDVEQFRKAGYQAIDRICDYYYSLQNRPVTSNVEPGYLRQHIPSTPPEKGEDFQVIADDYQKFIVPGLTHWQHPSFFAYYPTACTFEGMIADLYASSTCNPGFNWTSSPACTELEAITMDWACQLLGLSPDFMNSSGVGGGAIQNTASDSALIAVVAARALYQRDHPGVKMEDLVIYTTTQTHSLGLKAGLVLGLTVRALDVKAEDRFALRGETLRLAWQEDEERGKKPFILIATVGTTSSGAIDNLPEIQQIVRNHPSLWIHVDAAWAGSALSCPEYRERCHLSTINELAHSFCTNFHKWGLVNFDLSTLWVRDRKHLTEALDVTPPFLRTTHGDAGTVIDYRNWHLALGRRFRSLKLWFVLRSFGAEGFRRYIRKTISLNQQFADFIAESDLLSLVTPPSLALSVFRLEPKPKSPDKPLLSLESLNNLNKLFYGRISARNDILLTQTVLNGVHCIRFAVGAARTEASHIKQACELLHKEAELTLEAWEHTTLEDAK
ncbi:putative pyridoxal-dependent decarboxylase conserved domain containing protein [Lyophyllum shimeji]|uniref:Pyridoxal-dependent decarboxylase conserved domain containing protein n=1 Tax=Lyophyllum shimeji TaxID=47721 RepID=A0A9P3PL03_LYOSH|nr:putative pyridoxal-dependent decarboxylase conserved domain containing protein [Lyophyllum shimeji]